MQLCSPDDVQRYQRTKYHKIISYPKVVNYLLSTTGTIDFLNEADNAVRLRQHSFKVQRYADELAEGALKCGYVFDSK